MTTSHVYKVVILGSGFGGICSAIKLKEAGFHDFVILEKAGSLGGTWRDNTYPGCACDVPSELYSLSFDRNVDMLYKEPYTSQSTVLDYMRYLSDKYHLDQHFRFNRKVTELTWNERESMWSVKTEKGEAHFGTHVISAVGQMHLPMIPTFEGAETFQGDSFHTAKCTRSLEFFRGKRVAVIGNGASAIQVIPELAKVASHVEVFQRTPRHVLPKILWSLGSCPEWVRRSYRYLFRLMSEMLIFNAIQGYSLPLMLVKGLCWLNLRLGILFNADLRQKLTPTEPALARRMLFSNVYYPSLARQNVNVNVNGVSHFGKKGIVDSSGNHVAVDTIIYATGFQSNPWQAVNKTFGRNGRQLWDDNNPHAYLGIHTHGFPNLHFIYGPNTNTGHSSVFIFLEAQVGLILKAIQRLKTMGKRTMDVKENVEQNFVEEVDERMQSLAFTSVKRSHYVSGSGRVNVNWMGGAPEYVERCETIDWACYDFD